MHLYSTACGLAVVHSEGYPTIIPTLANLDTFCTDHMIDCQTDSMNDFILLGKVSFISSRDHDHDKPSKLNRLALKCFFANASQITNLSRRVNNELNLCFAPYSSLLLNDG